MHVAGADVRKGRWIGVVLADGRLDRAFPAKTISDAVDQLREAAAIGVDMPIGLPADGELRPGDERARRFVGLRCSSVFPTPPRQLLEAADHK